MNYWLPVGHVIVEKWVVADFAEKQFGETQMAAGTVVFVGNSVGVSDERYFSESLPKLNCCKIGQIFSVVDLSILLSPGQLQYHPAIMGTCLLGAQSSHISQNI